MWIVDIVPNDFHLFFYLCIKLNLKKSFISLLIFKFKCIWFFSRILFISVLQATMLDNMTFLILDKNLNVDQNHKLLQIWQRAPCKCNICTRFNLKSICSTSTRSICCTWICSICCTCICSVDWHILRSTDDKVLWSAWLLLRHV